MVPSQRSSIVVLGLNPSLQYQVSVSARTAGGGQGNDSNPIIVPPIPSPTLLPTPTKVPGKNQIADKCVSDPLIDYKDCVCVVSLPQPVHKLTAHY